MGKHRTNRKVVTGNRKDQQRRLKRTWTIKQPGRSEAQAYLPVEDMYLRLIKDGGY